jgi:tetratricopeptide (TPR) repeat protein
LRDELLEYSRQTLASTKGQKPLIASELDFDGIIRGIRRLQLSGRSEQAVAAIQRVREQDPALLTDDLQKIELDIWEGRGLAFLGHTFDIAEDKLRKAIQSLDNMPSSDSEFQNWKRQALLARAGNALGYLQRVQGRFQDAIDEYTTTLPLWRELKLEDEHANTLNNLAWALAEAGNFARAQRLCQDGLDLRLELGPRYPIALSYNTSGLIGTRYDQPHRARRHCERALSIFRDLGQQRGIGLASTALAEALRRSADVPGLYFPEERADLLRLGQQYAQEAVDIFKDAVYEPLRLVEAYLELGCTYRDWARLHPFYDHTGDPKRNELLVKGEQALRHCAKAAQNIPYRQVDALVNLAWLHYYIGDVGSAEQALEEALSIIPADYEITTQDGMPTQDQPVPFFWVQMGKAALLEGSMAFDRYQQDPQSKDLEKVAREYLFCLAYNELFSEDFRDLRRAKDQIYQRLKKLDIGNLQSVFRIAANIAQQYHMDQPRLVNFIEKDFGLHLGEKER